MTGSGSGSKCSCFTILDLRASFENQCTKPVSLVLVALAANMEARKRRFLRRSKEHNSGEDEKLSTCMKRSTCVCLTWTLVLIGGLGILLLITTVVALLAKSPFQLRDIVPGQPRMAATSVEDRLARALRLAGALAIPTVSYTPGHQNYTALREMNQYLDANFPALHSADYVHYAQVGNYSRFYRVEGSLGQAGGQPYLLGR